MIESRHVTDTIGGESFAAALKASPPVAVASATVTGVSLDDWVKVATLVYVVLQAAYLAFKFWRDLKAKRDS